MNRLFSRKLGLLLLALIAPLLAACSGGADNTKGPVVLAASSLQEAISDAADAWAAQGHPAPSLSFAASSALARQIEGGAPADLYLSADEDWMDHLQQAGLIRPETRSDLLTNSLVLIAPKGSEPPPAPDGAPQRIALADPEAVPAGRYAKAALENLGEWQAVEPGVVPAENVRAALALVERGEVPLGIVYATDAMASDKVEIRRRFPEESHPPIRYPVAILASSTSPDAQAFLDFLHTPEAQEIFAARGFGSAE